MEADDPQPREMQFAPALVVATCAGVGWIPVAPGTFGSLVGIPLALATGTVATSIAEATGMAAAGPVAAVEVAVIALLFAACVPIASRAASLLDSKDPGPVVIDEAIAVPLVLIVVPPADRGWLVLAAAFVLFRVFDILKPPPCRRLESLPGGLGIMADDQAAAVFGAVFLAVARWQGWL
jgi:phosphatidylglycerophosphatase A